MKRAGTLCRPAQSDCDISEVCDGARYSVAFVTRFSRDCQSRLPFGRSCRCGWHFVSSPQRHLRSSRAVRRSCAHLSRRFLSVGPFSFAVLPHSHCVLQAGFECRASLGPCDKAEKCRGDNKACPTDEYEPSTKVCRPPVNGCDEPETCTGAHLAGCLLARAHVRAAQQVARQCAPTTTCCRRRRCATTATCAPRATRATTSACVAAATRANARLIWTATTRIRAPSTSARKTPPLASCFASTLQVSRRRATQFIKIRFAPLGNAGAVCREQTGRCDVAEECTGTSADCPVDAVHDKGWTLIERAMKKQAYSFSQVKFVALVWAIVTWLKCVMAHTKRVRPTASKVCPRSRLDTNTVLQLPALFVASQKACATFKKRVMVFRYALFSAVCVTTGAARVSGRHHSRQRSSLSRPAGRLRFAGAREPVDRHARPLIRLCQCDGKSPMCPADRFDDAGAECRAAAGQQSRFFVHRC